MLTREIAESIVRETMNRLHRNINMMNIDGDIIASGDQSRLGERHEGALEAIRTGKPLVVSEENMDQWKARQCGLNIPISLHNKFVGAIGITGDPSEVSEFGELVKMTTELMLNQIDLMSHREWRNRAKEFIMEELMNSDPDYEKIDDRLRMLNIRLDPPFYSFILEMKEEMYHNNPNIRKAEDILGEEHAFIAILNTKQLLIVTHGLSEMQVSYKRELIKDTFQRNGIISRIGLSLPAKERCDIAPTIIEAKLALKFGEKDKEMNLYSGLEARSIVYLSDEANKRRFMSQVLPYISERMIQTLQVFFNCNTCVQETARALFVHKNTLIYRLKRIKDFTGYDPQVFSDAAALQMAIWIYLEKTNRIQQSPRNTRIDQKRKSIKQKNHIN